MVNSIFFLILSFDFFFVLIKLWILIGRGGYNIKQLREETKAKIFVNYNGPVGKYITINIFFFFFCKKVEFMEQLNSFV